jgi:hypothetical protein
MSLSFALNLVSRRRAQALASLAIGVSVGCSSQGNNPDVISDNVTGNGTIQIGDPVDYDGDGVIDGYAVDTNGDGMADAIDTNGDGVADKDLFGNDLPPTSACMGQYCDGNTKPPEQCGKTPFELSATKTNVMFLADGSNSMEMYWTGVRQAMADIINANPKLNFGVHMFYAEGNDLGGFLQALNACGEIKHPRFDLAKGQGQAIVDFMGGAPPGAGNQFFDRSPVLAGLNWYLENDSPLNDPESANFLVVFSDFVDTCFGTLFSNPGSVNTSAGKEQLLAFEKLAVELRKRHIRIIPIGFDANAANNSMGGAGGDVNEEALAALTNYGGTTITEPLIAANAADVKKAIDAIGVAVQPCRFTVPAVEEGKINAFKLSFLVNNKIVPRDRTKTEGWDFVEGKEEEVEFHGDACRALQSGMAKVEARTQCMGEEVCGVATTKVTTRPRALHVLLDGSGSMQGGIGGWAGAILNGQLTPWGEATAAIAQMVTNPINDGLEFGFQFFPISAEGGCGQIGAPEVPIGTGNEITIIDELLSNVPTGQTPLVGAMEYVASNPGRLVEPDVVGSLLVVSDGADSCADSGTRNQRLAAAANTLFTQGAKTYAVKFDSGSSDAAQEDQLTNIAVNGGTDAFVDAPDGKALTEELGKLSDNLASCELRLGELPPDIDPEKVNVYLNGIAIGFDSKGEKMQGWGWTSDTASGDYSKLELYGDACKLLQQSRLSEIALELGCTIVEVQ